MNRRDEMKIERRLPDADASVSFALLRISCAVNTSNEIVNSLIYKYSVESISRTISENERHGTMLDRRSRSRQEALETIALCRSISYAWFQCSANLK